MILWHKEWSSMSVTGPKDGEPHRVGVPIADLTAGLRATIGICAAVRHKEQRSAANTLIYLF